MGVVRFFKQNPLYLGFLAMIAFVAILAYVLLIRPQYQLSEQRNAELAAAEQNLRQAEQELAEAQATELEVSEDVVQWDKQREDQQFGLEYLQSSNRQLMYENIAPQAAVRIAQALENGELGEVYRYDEWKQDKAEGYTGWGGIATVKGNQPEAYAWVFYNPDGSIDYTKGVTGFSITPKGGHEVQIEQNGENDAKWNGYLRSTEVPLTHVITTSYLGHTEQPQVEGSPFIYPLNLNELQELDSQAIQRLEANMAAVFGPDWR